MKKFLVVLTILVLAAGFAFATVTGSVEAKYDFDFTEGTVNYGVDGTNGKISFTLSTDSGSSTGETKPYATATVALTYGGTIKKMTKAAALAWDDGAYYYDLSGDKVSALKWGLKVSDFRIVGENWEVNFLKAIKMGDYAKSSWEHDATDDEDPLNMNWDEFDDAEGITVTYDDYKVGVYAKVENENKANFNLRAESKEFSFAEGVTAQAAVAVGYAKTSADDSSFIFGGSLKGAYTSDKLSAKLATDMKYVSEDFDIEISANAAYAPVTFDAYFATSVENAPSHSMFGYTTKILSAKVVVDVESIAKNVPVKVTIVGENVLNNDRLIALKEEGTFGKLSEEFQIGLFPTVGKDFVVNYY